MQAKYKLVKLRQYKGKQVPLDTAKGMNLPYVAGTEQDVRLLTQTILPCIPAVIPEKEKHSELALF